jgi:hypothetical protein
MIKKRVSFLIGAGASCSLGIPTMAAFWRDFERSLLKKNRDLHKILIETKKLLNIEDDLEDMIIGLKSIMDINKDPCTKVMLKVLTLHGTKVNKSKIIALQRILSKKAGEVSILYTTILNFIKEVVIRYDREQAGLLYAPIFDLLPKTRLIFFTTNYDSVLEGVCEDRQIEFFDNLVKKQNRFFWDKNYTGVGITDVEIIKLHGSVSWYLRKDKKIEKIRFLTRLTEEGIPVDNLMIMPTKFKEIYNEPFFRLYLEFLRILEKSKLFVIIGHSLRDEYIKAAIYERLRDKDFILIVISPQPTPGSELQKLKKLKNVLYCPLKFDEFSRELGEILKTALTNYATAIEKLKSFRLLRAKKVTSLRLKTYKKSYNGGDELRYVLNLKGLIYDGSIEIKFFNKIENNEQVIFSPKSENYQELIGIMDGRIDFKKSFVWQIPDGLPPGEHVLICTVFERDKQIKEYQKSVIIS